jgi:hypothetical protein
MLVEEVVVVVVMEVVVTWMMMRLRDVRVAMLVCLHLGKILLTKVAVQLVTETEAQTDASVVLLTMCETLL